MQTNLGSANLYDTSPVFQGNDFSLAWTATGGWGNISLNKQLNFNTSPYIALHFVAQAGQAGSHYAIQLIGTNGQGLSQYLLLANYGGDPQPGSWKVYNIPLSDLGAVGKHIQAIGLQNYSSNSNQVMYMDEVTFQ